MAGVWGSSWPVPFVVPPCTQSAILRNRHKVPRGTGSFGRIAAAFLRIVYGESYAYFFIADSIRWLSAMGVSSRWKRPVKWAERLQTPSQQRPREELRSRLGWTHLRSWSGARSGAGAAFDGAVGTIGIDVERPSGSLDHFARDHDLFDAFQARKIEHGLEQDAFENRAQSTRAGLALDRLAGDRAKRLVGEGQLDILHLEQPLILFHQRVLRIGQNLLQRSLVQIFQGRDDRQAADEFRDQAVLQEILGLDMTEDFTGAAIFRRQHLGREADRGRAPARRDDLLKPRERATADEQDVRGVDLQELLLRMLAATLRRNRVHRAFHDLQQRLLHALTRHVTGDRRVVGLAADLVDFVDIDDA